MRHFQSALQSVDCLGLQSAQIGTGERSLAKLSQQTLLTGMSVGLRVQNAVLIDATGLRGINSQETLILFAEGVAPNFVAEQNPAVAVMQRSNGGNQCVLDGGKAAAQPQNHGITTRHGEAQGLAIAQYVGKCPAID